MIHIGFEGSPDERSSKFCLKNENICKDWGAYVTKRQGDLNAKYTAWAVKGQGHLDSEKSWLINFEKSKMTNPSLLDFSLMAKPGEGHESMTLHCKNYHQSQSFKLHKKSFSDSIKMMLGQKLQEIRKDYILETDSTLHRGASKLIEILKTEPILYNLEWLKYSKEQKQLDLKFDRLLMNFDFLNKIIDANDTSYSRL